MGCLALMSHLLDVTFNPPDVHNLCRQVWTMSLAVCFKSFGVVGVHLTTVNFPHPDLISWALKQVFRKTSLYFDLIHLCYNPDKLPSPCCPHDVANTVHYCRDVTDQVIGRAWFSLDITPVSQTTESCFFFLPKTGFLLANLKWAVMWLLLRSGFSLATLQETVSFWQVLSSLHRTSDGHLQLPSKTLFSSLIIASKISQHNQLHRPWKNNQCGVLHLIHIPKCLTQRYLNLGVTKWWQGGWGPISGSQILTWTVNCPQKEFSTGESHCRNLKMGCPWAHDFVVWILLQVFQFAKKITKRCATL